ncbi:MAG: methylated-DNA--[protein]-cysteine S-methyltransferase [Acidobacteria bacterium]|nr:methylated-DNA--[protein]-cysteine S-methyltransferase [Acidobacteriota bacterium]MBV9478881.1 methylated-DNA--[protein]-cysteine S-methyltransferase [Acidobacteriota bacterium]
MSFDSRIGPLHVAIDDDERVVAVSFRPHGLREADASHPAIVQLREYFDGKRTVFELDLAPRGTEFQRAVWDELLRVPYGATVTYAEIAHRIGRPNAVRAVGAANGANPIAVIVPCHRVIGSNGTLTGYGGGIERKQWLLAHEGRRLF